MLLLHLSNNIVANSLAGLKANKLKRGFVLYNGIDGIFFNEPAKEYTNIRSEFGIESDIVLLVSVANLIPYKDYDTVIKALSLIKKEGILFRFIAVGEGSERKRIENLVKSLDLSGEVFLPGRRVDIKDILYASDIFIHSSIGEGCSNAILEAMAAGLPVIASETGGTSEIVYKETGKLFKYQDVEQLAQMLKDVITNKSLRADLSENAKKKALTDFSNDKMMLNYYNIIGRVIQ
jgi:glycosyltransferase involved in cell wall biosynthesis